MHEFDLLRHIYAASADMGQHVPIPPGDDMGMVRLRGSGREILAAVDQVIDGRHVHLATTPLELVGRKAITRSLSDIAAMAARPVATLAAAVLPPDFRPQRATALFDAMRAAAAQYDCPLVGGDIAIHSSAAFPLVCSVTVLAEPAATPPITRGGAKAGDTLYVTGRLGGSMQSDGLGRHLTFEPRITLAMELASTLGERLHAMIDLSDGLGRDASHIAEQSGVSIRIHADRLPCNDGCDWRAAMGDGEDYELCFAATGPVPDALAGVPITAVGEVLPFDPRDAYRVGVVVGEAVIAADDLGWQHEAQAES